MAKQQGMEKFLLQKAAQGDAKAFGEIVRMYQHPVYAMAVQITRDPAAAQDISQDTFISAFKALKNLRSEDSFAPWLRSITRNMALSWRKEQGRIASLEEAGTLPSQFNPPRIEIEAEHGDVETFKEGVRQILSSLSDALRFPILLCYLNGVSTAEAASFLGIKEGTLRKRLHEGKKKLQMKIVRMAERTLQEYRLPPGFARRCICGCQRGRLAAKDQKLGKEVIKMASKESSCGCGCVEMKPSSCKGTNKKKAQKSK
jgi:RNA polymerase sigma-70 factor (ECF subfamily)